MRSTRRRRSRWPCTGRRPRPFPTLRLSVRSTPSVSRWRAGISPVRPSGTSSGPARQSGWWRSACPAQPGGCRLVDRDRVEGVAAFTAGCRVAEAAEGRAAGVGGHPSRKIFAPGSRAHSSTDASPEPPALSDPCTRPSRWLELVLAGALAFEVGAVTSVWKLVVALGVAGAAWTCPSLSVARV